jgi:hypothetical protein
LISAALIVAAFLIPCFPFLLLRYFPGELGAATVLFAGSLAVASVLFFLAAGPGAGFMLTGSSVTFGIACWAQAASGRKQS